ncbi:hypothetical protein [Mesorhizobium sp. STM 4661]|uniref:hypothetical protein n=1 Tax=Mesorhizobium sp. STM 4661 TaxID=1297570 RepID=UPI0002BD7322|nr:hypothetical protein [Mesorhizobium sp. STM 4661]CCV13301.1 hypothetical protein MESS4_530107 [Mesorhizobium sp. STM 4661]
MQEFAGVQARITKKTDGQIDVVAAVDPFLVVIADGMTDDMRRKAAVGSAPQEGRLGHGREFGRANERPLRVELDRLGAIGFDLIDTQKST